MKTIQCRTHGGTFQITPKRGRPPVRCDESNPCTRESTSQKVNSRRTAPAGTNVAAKAAMEERTIRAAVKRAAARANGPVEVTESPAEPLTGTNTSVPMALNARALLEPQGWACTARTTGPQTVQFVATRGTERITMVWEHGEITSQDYTLWDTHKPSANGKPANRTKLPFDTNELTDSELVRALSGMKAIWWNRIAQGEESAVLPSKVQITHTYNGTGDEMSDDRVITFVDVHGSGFRSFRVGALMRIGK